MERNKLVQELHNKRIIVDGKHIFLENSPFCPNPTPEVSVKHIDSSYDHLFRRAPPTDPGTTDDTLVATKLEHEEPDLHLIEIGSQVPKEIKEKLKSIHMANKDVFDDDLSYGYNGESGDFEVNFNFTGGIPPKPNYYNAPPYNLSKDDILMQAKIDSLEEQGIVVKVADTDIIPRYAACWHSRILLKVSNLVNMKSSQYYKS